MDRPAVNRAATRRLISCGGVLYRYPFGGGLEFLLVGRQHPPLWALPKGTPHDGETIEQTALREIEEETGVLGQIVAPLGSITYTFRTPPRGVVLPWRTPRSQDGRGETATPNTRFHKTVHHFLLRPVAGDTALHDAEYDFARWLPAADALSAVSHENERAVLRRALSLLGHVGGHPGSAGRKAGAEISRASRRRRRV